MKAFIAVDAALLLAFGVVLVVFLTGGIGGSATGGAEPSDRPASGADPTEGSTSPDDEPAGDETTGDEPAGEAATFALPSGNIACDITADAATCTIANSTATPPEDATCAGAIGPVLTVTADGAATPCVEGALPGTAAPGTTVLDYGQSTTVGDFTCTSSSTGVTCKHDPSGQGFQLARAGAELF